MSKIKRNKIKYDEMKSLDTEEDNEKDIEYHDVANQTAVRELDNWVKYGVARCEICYSTNLKPEVIPNEEGEKVEKIICQDCREEVG